MCLRIPLAACAALVCSVVMQVGFVGCCEWKEPAQEDKSVEIDNKEDVARLGGNLASGGDYRGAVGTTGDGTIPYFEYPGNAEVPSAADVVKELSGTEKKLEAAARAEKEARKEAELAARFRRTVEKGWRNEDLLRDFALKESPTIWQTVQRLRTEIAERRRAIAQLGRELKEFGTNPDSDPDYIKLGKNVDVLLDSLVAIFVNLEKAYIAAKKFEAMPVRKDYESTMRNALKESFEEADSATRRFFEMRKRK